MRSISTDRIRNDTFIFRCVAEATSISSTAVKITITALQLVLLTIAKSENSTTKQKSNNDGNSVLRLSVKVNL